VRGKAVQEIRNEETEAKGLLDIFGNPPVVICVLTPTKEGYKLFVMSNDDQLEVALLGTRRYDAAKQGLSGLTE